MPIILNKNTGEYFIANDEREQNIYLKKLLTHKQPTSSLEWTCKYDSCTYLKSVIRWNRKDNIIIVPPTTELYVLQNKNYQLISLNM